MASTNKTSRGLSLWESTDKPEHGDFNSDNRIIDQALEDLKTQVGTAEAELSEHLANAGLHGDASNFVMGTYQGTGALGYTVNLGFRPRFAVVFGVEQPIVSVNFGNNQAGVYAAMVSEYGCSAADVTDNGFTVWHDYGYDSMGLGYKLNVKDATYIYFAVR